MVKNKNDVNEQDDFIIALPFSYPNIPFTVFQYPLLIDRKVLFLAWLSKRFVQEKTINKKPRNKTNPKGFGENGGDMYTKIQKPHKIWIEIIPESTQGKYITANSPYQNHSDSKKG